MHFTTCHIRRVPAMLVSFGVVACCVAGCGRKDGLETVEVTGRVTLNRLPLTSGMVAFMRPEGPVAKGRIGDDGSFRMEPYIDGRGTGVVVGHYQVIISAPDPKALATAKRSEFVPSLIPRRYSMPSDSPLVCDVKAGQANITDFELTSP